MSGVRGPGRQVVPGTTISSETAAHITSLILEPVSENDTTVGLCVYIDGDGPGVSLSPGTARRVARELVGRARRVEELRRGDAS